MSEHCQQDGGFIGECGCTHPNHRHSELVESLLAEKEPRMITAEEADKALTEGFYIENPDGTRVGFGKNLLAHFGKTEEHSPDDADERKKRLLYAVETIRKPDKTEANHRKIPGRSAYSKAFDEFGVLAITGPGRDKIDKVYTYFPQRGGRKKP